MEPTPITPELLLPDSNPVTVEGFEELTEDEASERHRLELKVERAFYEATVTLRQLRDQQLYRSTHHRFDHYLSEHFGSYLG